MIERSLFEPNASSPISEALDGVVGSTLLEATTLLAIIAFALLGLVLLGGRLPLKRAGFAIIGCFIALGAPALASSFLSLANQSATNVRTYKPALEPRIESLRELPPASRDPYDGASPQFD